MNDWANDITTFCIHALWIGLLFSVALAGVLHLIPERHSRSRYSLAYASLAMTAILPLLLVMSAFSPFTTSVQALPRSPGWIPIAISSLWLTGVCWKSLGFAIAMYRALRMRMESRPVSDPATQSEFDKIRTHSGCGERLRILQHPEIDGPLFSGWLFPAIILPTAWLSGVPLEHLRAVLLHECAHARRWDYLANLVQEVLEILLCFHPAAWWMSGVIRREREHCCDDFAIGHTAAPIAYSQALVWFESFRNSGDFHRLCPSMDGNDSIQPRILRLLRVNRSQRQTSSTAAISGALALLLSLGSIATLLGAGSVLIRSERPEYLPDPVGIVSEYPPFAPSSPQVISVLEDPVEINSDSPFGSRIIIEKGGVLYDLTKGYPVLHPPLPNLYLTENSLPLLDSNLPFRDLDGDGFTVLEEFQAGTNPKNDESHPAFAEKLQFISRKQQNYRVKFAARPDHIRFQLIRLPSAKWPEKETFFVQTGDTTADGILKIEDFVEKVAQNNVGIHVDASELSVVFLPTGEHSRLVRNIEEELPIYFAEFKTTIPVEKAFFVKKGDTFVVPGDDEKWLLESVFEKECVIKNETTGIRVTKKARP